MKGYCEVTQPKDDYNTRAVLLVHAEHD